MRVLEGRDVVLIEDIMDSWSYTFLSHQYIEGAQTGKL